MNENDRTTLEQAIYEEMELTPEMIRSIRTLCGVCLCSFVESKAFKIAIVQAEQIFTVDKSRVLKFLGHLTPEEMNRVDDAVRASLALNSMGVFSGFHLSSALRRLTHRLRWLTASRPSILTRPSNRPLRTPEALRT